MSKKVVNKQALLIKKEKLLSEIKYYEKRIEDARNKKKNYNVFEEDSSDSEVELIINPGPSINELELKKSHLQTCLQATQELTGLHILQSEVNVLVDAPTFEGEPSITEEGLWREVMADCRIDLVSFSITFYIHQPEHVFGQPQYRALRVAPLKEVHEAELANSVLPTLTTPSDAVEVVRGYAQAVRSRRASLSRLAERYAEHLFMETVPEGGYMLKCADLLQVSWTLHNKVSAVAPFQHKMSFDLEYMEESYVRTITQAHRQLGDPTVDTDQRTLLLAKIIDTCLEARRTAPEDSMESDIESQNSKRLQSDQESGNVDKPEIMGPPKSLPKKVKPKGKENSDNTNNARKRANDTNKELNAKKPRTDTKSGKNGINSKNNENSSKSNVNNESNNSAANEQSIGKNKAKNSQKSHEIEVSKSTNALQNKGNVQPKSNFVNSNKNSNVGTLSADNLAGTKNNKNIDNLKAKTVTDKELKSKESKQKKVIEKVSIKNNNVNEGNLDRNPTLVNKIPTNNPKTKVNEGEPKNKKSKKSITEKTNKIVPKNPKDIIEKNKNVITDTQSEIDDKVIAEKNNQKNYKNPKSTNELHQNFNKNVANSKQNTNKENNLNDDLVSQKNKKTDKSSENVDKLNKDSRNNSDLNKNKKNQTKTTKSNNDTETHQYGNFPTIYQRFSSKNTLQTNNIEKPLNQNNKDTNLITDFNKNVPKSGLNSKNKQAFTKNLHEYKSKLINDNKSTKNDFNTKINENVLNNDKNNPNYDKALTKNSSSNKNVVNLKAVNNLNKNPPKINLNNKLNKQKLRKSIGAMKIVSKTTKSDENKPKSKIPQKRLSILKHAMGNPLRISPRRPQAKLCVSQDSSKSSIASQHKHTNIPRLIKKPQLKPKT